MNEPVPQGTPANSPSQPGEQAPAAATPFQIHFKTIFWTVVGFTGLFWLSFLALAVFGPHTDEAKTAMETFKNAGLSGVGTIFGLAGGALNGTNGGNASS